MKIRKLAHCCLVIDVRAADGSARRIVTDPGYYSLERHEKISHADIVLITHEHADHFHIESLKAMVRRIPGVAIITNDAVGEILAREGIAHRIMKHGDVLDHLGVRIEAIGEKHALMHSSLPPVSNVGFFIESKLFYPGDAFTDPRKKVDILALPVAGPWMKISEAVDYALALKPRAAFPVHDGMRIPTQHLLPEKILGQNGIDFIKIEEDQEIETK